MFEPADLHERMSQQGPDANGFEWCVESNGMA